MIVKIIFVNLSEKIVNMNANKDQQTEEGLSPTVAWHLLHLCSTSLHELRQRQQEPVHRIGRRMAHHTFEANP